MKILFRLDNSDLNKDFLIRNANYVNFQCLYSSASSNTGQFDLRNRILRFRSAFAWECLRVAVNCLDNMKNLQETFDWLD